MTLTKATRALTIATTIAAAAIIAATAASAGKPKLEPDTCHQLHGERDKLVAAGVEKDMANGPEWARTHLSRTQLTEIEHYIQVDEQLQFGCREASLTPEQARAAEVARRIELNSDADPLAPLPTKKKSVKPKANSPKANAPKTTKSGAPPAPSNKTSIKPAKSGARATNRRWAANVTPAAADHDQRR